MVHLDRFISGVQDGYLLQDNDFELLDYDHLGNVISVKYKGVVHAWVGQKLVNSNILRVFTIEHKRIFSLKQCMM
jgi:hypothetical protein